jgi:hypothetical protein
VLPTDLQTLRDRLEELTEVFERKSVSKKALGVWFDVLKEFPVERVAGVLISWPKLHTKFPSPAEVWKIVSEATSFERESRAAQENRSQPFYPGVGGRQAQEFIASIRKILNRPKWTPRQHWQRLLESSAPGSIGHRYAVDALKKIGARAAREPGEDDEELAA